MEDTGSGGAASVGLGAKPGPVGAGKTRMQGRTWGQDEDTSQGSVNLRIEL